MIENKTGSKTVYYCEADGCSFNSTVAEFTQRHEYLKHDSLTANQIIDYKGAKARIDLLEKALRIAAGMISATDGCRNMHPEAVLKLIMADAEQMQSCDNEVVLDSGFEEWKIHVGAIAEGEKIRRLIQRPVTLGSVLDAKAALDVCGLAPFTDGCLRADLSDSSLLELYQDHQFLVAYQSRYKELPGGLNIFELFGIQFRRCTADKMYQPRIIGIKPKEKP
jgi:hypothetical protein